MGSDFAVIARLRGGLAVFEHSLAGYGVWGSVGGQNVVASGFQMISHTKLEMGRFGPWNGGLGGL